MALRKIPPPSTQAAHNTILSGLNPHEMDNSHFMKKLEIAHPIQPPRLIRNRKLKERFQKGHV
jgi:hypothetical protein